ncbi:esterase-like activity of phytase family protein [Rubellimicrobium roseum]|uniref:Esterase-like activity of phytase family protein n=2 Tax=Rubellimicrobium roseum TaxID=687525 RepID=A0A5C4NKF7_9RHOB|nr:esterase-like activity of phytase family protein [Rubellimicrobium roseum]
MSAIEMADDGLSFTAMSDRSAIVSGRLLRDEAGAVIGVVTPKADRLLDRGGDPLQGKRADSEGLAIAADGRVWISFEGDTRVRQQGRDGRLPFLLPEHPDFARMRDNGGLEALAVDAENRLYTLAERPIPGERDLALHRFDGHRWEIAFRLPVGDGFSVSGADIGPDGRLYLLERDFTGLGFRSRLRRIDLDGTGETVLLTTATGTHDNLEGVAIWQDAQGLRATMIADDNGFFFQETQIVDYRLPD